MNFFTLGLGSSVDFLHNILLLCLIAFETYLHPKNLVALCPQKIVTTCYQSFMK